MIFFAGPGKDSTGKEGSPLIIIDELKKYLANPFLPVASGISINLFFNDLVSNKVGLLKNNIPQNDKDAFRIEITNKTFEEAFNAKSSIFEMPSAAKLAILDQTGVKQITPDIFGQLINFPATDFMFFISSFYLRRFLCVEEIGKYFPDMSTDEIKNVPATDIHRSVCNYYQKLIPLEKEFYLVPFSIKKGSNIYGIIFGSGKLFGLEKFLSVCWNKDEISGEANYDIDDDMARSGEELLFDEMRIPYKIDVFRKRLIGFLQDFRSNNDLYKFTLENGCLPKHTKEILSELQKEGSLEAKPFDI